MNRLFSMLRYTTVIALVTVLAVVSGCDEPPEPIVPTLNIKELISSDAYKQSATVPAENALDTLAYYINLFPDLVALMTSTGPNTFFAPSNSAFANLKATNGFPTQPDAIKLINPDLIKGVLAYHFVEGKKFKADLVAGSELATKFTDTQLAPGAPQKITINTDITLKASPRAANTAIDIVVQDGEATNGIVHVIESVMIPPSTGEVLVPILGTVAGTVILSKSFTNLTKVIMAADNGFEQNPAELKFKVTTWLAMPISTPNAATANLKGITFFAPPNTAGSTPIFTEAAANALIATADHGRAFLLNHLVVVFPGGVQTIGQYTVAEAPATNPNGITKFADNQTIRPRSGEAKTILVKVLTPSATNPYGVVVTNVLPNPNPATDFRPILAKDLAASNGVLHAIGGALQ